LTLEHDLEAGSFDLRDCGAAFRSHAIEFALPLPLHSRDNGTERIGQHGVGVGAGLAASH
jgi:hypothetical protein